MPGGFPLGPDLCNGTSYGVDLTNSVGTALTGGASNTKGSYTQLVAATTFDACWIMVSIKETSNSTTHCAVDIAIGAGGSEKVILSNLMVEGSTNGTSGANSLFPCNIPAGTKISARAQNGGAVADGPTVSIILFDGGFTQFEGAAGADDIGFVSATTYGSLITASASANTKGSYTQLVAATARDYIGFVLYFGAPSTGAGASRGLYDIAIGSIGSEIVIVPNIGANAVQVNSKPAYSGPFFINIPAGTRIAARMQADTGSQAGGMVLYGIYQ